MQHSVDGLGVRVQVKRCTHAAYHHGQHIAQRITDSQDQLRARFFKPHLQPARVSFAVCLNAKSASGAVFNWAVCYGFDSSDAALAHKGQHRRHVIRRAVGELYRDALPAALGLRLGYRAPKLRRVEFVMPHESRVKAPQAGKAAHQRNLRDGQ